MLPRMMALGALLAAGLLLAGPAAAGVQIVLKSGEVLDGVDLQKKPTWYVLFLADDSVLTVAADQVAEVRLFSDDPEAGGRTAAPGEADRGGEDAAGSSEAPASPEPAAPSDEPAGAPAPSPGRDVGRGETAEQARQRQEQEGYDPVRPPALQQPEEPATLAGGSDTDTRDLRSPETRDLARPDPAAAGSWPPSGTWEPQSDWPREDPLWEKNTWRPGKAEGEWIPDSDWAQDPSANNWNPSTWTKPAKDPTWRPTEGWIKTDTSFTIDPDQVAADAAASGAVPAVPDGDMVEGPASWYGEPFRGAKTASGEPFDPDALTAAHSSLPFGTLLKVSRPDGSKAVIVEVTDRGPVDRVVNLSEAAARELDILKEGVVTVRVEPMPAALGGTPPPAPPEGAPAIPVRPADEPPPPSGADGG